VAGSPPLRAYLPHQGQKRGIRANFHCAFVGIVALRHQQGADNSLVRTHVSDADAGRLDDVDDVDESQKTANAGTLPALRLHISSSDD
jgi:hypothetical protein